MTLKQKLFLKELPNNNFNISKTMKKVGYSNATSVSGEQYNILRRITNKEYFDEEFIKREYKRTLKEARKQKDLTNKLRALEGMARIKSMFTDKSEITNKNPDKIVIAYGSNVNKPVDNSNNQDVNNVNNSNIEPIANKEVI